MSSSSRKFVIGIVLCLSVLSLAVSVWATRPASKTPVQKVRVVASYPHDAQAFTQGLVIHKGELYEGTGQKGASTLRKVDLKSGQVLESFQLHPEYFGEGITILNDKVYQLTWQNNVGLVFDLNSKRYESNFRYTHEGWGITNNSKELIISDGSSTIRFLDPKTFKEVRRVVVREGKNRIKMLNELEFIDGAIWANVWYEDRIAKISPDDGQIMAWVDLTHVYPSNQRNKEAVLNGIAYDAESKKIFITGKNWPQLYEIELLP
jgi:glutamine cyclotransferase